MNKLALLALKQELGASHLYHSSGMTHHWKPKYMFVFDGTAARVPKTHAGSIESIKAYASDPIHRTQLPPLYKDYVNWEEV
ncbi:MAG: hypothetical protein GY776_07040 [Alteromonas sp.]|nr:hypothetical protein [Alteromonas sp.]